MQPRHGLLKVRKSTVQMIQFSAFLHTNLTATVHLYSHIASPTSSFSLFEVQKSSNPKTKFVIQILNVV